METVCTPERSGRKRFLNLFAIAEPGLNEFYAPEARMDNTSVH